MRIRSLAFVTIILAYFLIVFGGYVASSESGMGCGPDWPLCNGVLIPALEGATLIEYSHRVIGAILFILSLLLFFTVRHANSEGHIRTVAIWMFILLFIQVILGAIVVVLDLPAIVVTIHLLIAMAYLACLLFIWKSQARVNSVITEKNNLLKHLALLIILLLFTLGLGAYIKHQSYGLACGWLDCYNSWVPISNAQILQTLHRLFALGSTVYIVGLTYFAFRNKLNSRIQTRLTLASIVVFIQIAVGVFTIISSISLPLAVIHLGVGTALFGIIIEAWITLFLSSSRITLGDWTSSRSTFR